MSAGTFTVTTNPLIYHSANLTMTATCVNTRPFYVKRVEWLSPQSVGDTVKITDSGGNVIVEGVCEVALQSQILWTGPQKFPLPQNSGAQLGWQIQFVSATTTTNLLVWF